MYRVGNTKRFHMSCPVQTILSLPLLNMNTRRLLKLETLMYVIPFTSLYTKVGARDYMRLTFLRVEKVRSYVNLVHFSHILTSMQL